MWFQNNDGSFSQSNDPQIVSYHAMLQEIQLWKGENPIDISAGVDYVSIFEGRVFAKTELENVINKYVNSFKRLELSEPQYDGETVSFELIAEFNTGETAKKIIQF